MFSILGALLVGYGLFTRDSDIYARSGGYNINLDWGLVLLVFGMMPFYYGSKARSVPEYLKLRFDEKTRDSTRSPSPR